MKFVYIVRTRNDRVLAVAGSVTRAVAIMVRHAVSKRKLRGFDGFDPINNDEIVKLVRKEGAYYHCGYGSIEKLPLA